MSSSKLSVEHVHLDSDRPFEEVAAAIERQLGRFDPEAYRELAAGKDMAAVQARLDEAAGPSSFVLFTTHDHGGLLRLAGQKRKALQYIVGNPLIAIQMTRHDIRAALYAPLRVLLYENEEGKTCVEYDKPSSLFGQFGDRKVDAVASTLDEKLETLLRKAMR